MLKTSKMINLIFTKAQSGCQYGMNADNEKAKDFLKQRNAVRCACVAKPTNYCPKIPRRNACKHHGLVVSEENISINFCY